MRLDQALREARDAGDQQEIAAIQTKLGELRSRREVQP